MDSSLMLAIIGIVTGIIIGLPGAILSAWCLVEKWKHKENNPDEPPSLDYHQWQILSDERSSGCEQEKAVDNHEKEEQ